ncbi:hypothetical protein E2320_002237 [Naja naja]|nr:hypothetical protein E2320_002237 [Naja naja]
MHPNLHESHVGMPSIIGIRLKSGLWCEGIKLQWCLLTETDLTLQMVLNVTQATEISNQSMAEIQKSNSPPALQKPVTVHHEDAKHGESADEDDMSIASNLPRGGMWPQKRSNQHVFVVAATTHEWLLSSRMPSVKDVKRKDIWPMFIAQTNRKLPLQAQKLAPKE